MAGVERREFAVIGGGLLGLATAQVLARRGRDVVCLERWVVGGPWSGSKGGARIFRLSYDDPAYVELAKLALEEWRRLEQASGEQLLWPCGLLAYGDGLEQLVASMTEAGAEARLLDAPACAERYPRLARPGPAVLDPAGAVALADRALAALRSTGGFEVREGCEVSALAASDDGVELATASGTVACEVAVVCAGPGTSGLLDGTGIACRLTATLEQVAYFALGDAPAPAPGDGAATALGGLPAVVVRTGTGNVDAGGRSEYLASYGLPSPDLGWYKLGLHHAGLPLGVGPAAAPPGGTARLAYGAGEAAVLDGDVELTEQLAADAAALLRAVDPVPRLVERCVYDTTADQDFVLDRVGRVVVGAGTSGHGFKFGPLLGRVLADLATGAAPPVAIGRFALRRAAVAN